MWRIRNPFSMWVLPLRTAGGAVVLYAFVRMLANPDISAIVFAFAGSLLWQAGAAAQTNSPLYRRLRSASVEEVMRSRPIRAQSSLSVSDFRSEYSDLGPDVFVVTTQDGYDAGVATPEKLRSIVGDAARHTSIAQVSHTLSYLHALRLDDPVLEAYLRFNASHHVFLPVLDQRGVLAGIVTLQDIHSWLDEPSRGRSRILDRSVRPSAGMTPEKLAA